MQNIKFQELFGKDFKDANYAVSTNWRIDFSKSTEFATLIGDKVAAQLSFACHSTFKFEAKQEYASAKVKGIPIRQAAWQDREITSLTLDVYEHMDHRVFKAMLKASNNVAGFLNHRNVAPKEKYTFNDVWLYALGNLASDGEPETQAAYRLLGMQINGISSPEYTSDNANIGSVTLDLYAHGWLEASEE